MDSTTTPPVDKSSGSEVDVTMNHDERELVSPSVRCCGMCDYANGNLIEEASNHKHITTSLQLLDNGYMNKYSNKTLEHSILHGVCKQVTSVTLGNTRDEEATEQFLPFGDTSDVCPSLTGSKHVHMVLLLSVDVRSSLPAVDRRSIACVGLTQSTPTKYIFSMGKNSSFRGTMNHKNVRVVTKDDSNRVLDSCFYLASPLQLTKDNLEQMMEAAKFAKKRMQAEQKNLFTAKPGRSQSDIGTELFQQELKARNLDRLYGIGAYLYPSACTFSLSQNRIANLPNPPAIDKFNGVHLVKACYLVLPVPVD